MCTYLQGPRQGGMYYFRRGVPAVLRPIIGQREFSISLGVKDRTAAKALIPAMVIETNAVMARALATLAAREVPSSQPSRWDAQEEARFENAREADAIGLAEDRADEERRKALEANVERWKLRLHQPVETLSPDEAALQVVRKDEAYDLMVANEALANLRARHAGEPQPAQPLSLATSGSGVSITGLFERYAAQDGIRSATVRQFRAIITHLVAFLGHDDASRVDQQDVMRWRNHLRIEPSKTGKPRAAKTINGSYMAAANVTFAYGLNEMAITANPMAAVGKVRADNAVKVRDKDFTTQERMTILSATLRPQPASLAEEHAFARRWVPWLCAYTGARVNEITQLRVEDVSQRDGIWTINITPEAGAVKTDEARLVPLHEHLVAQGFVEAARAKANGPLFYNLNRGFGKTDRQPSKRMGMRLAQWVRSLGISHPAIKPNHAWRHTFKTIAAEVGMHERAADYIQGHATKGVGRSYGSNTLAGLSAQLALFPRFEVISDRDKLASDYR